MKISKQKKDKISEQILVYLYSVNHRPVFTSQIACEIARDEEFVKKLLIELKKQNLITEINKNPKGKIYIKRQRWKLSDKAYEVYRKHNN